MAKDERETNEERRSHGEQYPGHDEGEEPQEQHGAAHGGEPAHGSDIRAGSPGTGTSAQEVVEPRPTAPAAGASLDERPDLLEAVDKEAQVTAESRSEEPRDAPPAGHDPQIAPSDSASSAPPAREDLPGSD
jgi:hypothetical protein